MTRRFVLLSLVVGAVGCSGSGGGAEVDEIFLALDGAMFPGIISAQAENQGDGVATVDKTIDCMGGGTLTLAGTLDRTTGRLVTDYVVTLSACVRDGITMTGTINYDHDAQSAAPSPKQYAGTLSLVGASLDSCELAFTITASSDTPCQLTYAGTLCGESGRAPLGDTCPTP